MQHQFRTTHWSAVIAAGRGSSPEARRALASLCEIYWYPLYAYARRRVPNVHEAQDLTQAFLAELLERNYVGAATPDRGRFRAFHPLGFDVVGISWPNDQRREVCHIVNAFEPTGTDRMFS